ncbi:Paf1 complex component [Coniothyrium glycines]
MSDAELDPTLSDNELETQATPGEAGEGGTPRDTVEENGLDVEDDDLFGDGDEDDAPAEQRKLDDGELDSGDDEGRADRVPPQDVGDGEVEQQTFAYMDADLARHAVPEPTDNELYLLKVPGFVSFEPTAFSHKTFQPPTTDHHSKLAASEHFSPYNTAMSTVRWRRSPQNNALLQSNARILRWSDGSLTLQLASDPTNQYEISATTLAPPQVRPKIKTPTSIEHDKSGSKGNLKKESYTYLVAPYEEANVMRVTNKLTTSLSVEPLINSQDAALEALQNALVKNAHRGRDAANQAISFIDVNEDPELRRQREEATFKEKQRQARAREKHEARQAERANRTMGRSGARASGGLDIDDLEGAPRKSGKPRPKGGRRDWSDDEDYGRGPGRNREDDYDEEDDFIAASDEEPEIVDDDDDLDDGIEASPKRARGGDDDEADDVIVSRTKRRRVVDDDDDEE